MKRSKRLFLITLILALFACTFCLAIGCDGCNPKNPSTNEITAFTIEDWTYGEEPKSPSITVTFGNAVFTYSATEDGEYTSTVPTKAGTYWVKASVSATADYAAVEKKISFNILKADNTLTGFDEINNISCCEIPVLNAVAKEGQVIYTYSTTEDGVYGEAPASFTCGTYYVKATSLGNDNYNSVSLKKSFVVSHNFVEVVDAEYLKNEANCVHYATYYKSCACKDKGTETFEYAQGGYGEHKDTEQKERIEPTCHTFGYEAGVYCKDCEQYIEGHNQIAMTEHNFEIDSVNSRAANCEEDGVIAYRCSCEGCLATKTEKGEDAKGHNVEKWEETGRTLVVGETCKYNVTYSGTCKTCGKTDTKTENGVEIHEFYWKVTKEPTCQADGEKQEFCSHEGCYYHDNAHNTAVYELPAGAEGHNWVEDDATHFHCGNAGCLETKTIISSTEDKLEQIDASTLSEVDEIQLSTAKVSMDDDVKSALGSAKVSISAEEKKVEDINTTKLSEEDKKKVENAKAIFDFTLTKDNETQSDLNGYITIRIPYTLQPGDDLEKISVVCVKDDGTIESFKAVYANGFITFATNHFSIYSVVELTPKEYCEQNNCHTEDYIKANSDKFQIIAPTCTIGGYTVCLNCGEIFNLTPASGHSWIHNTTKTATCTENGTEHHECVVCGINYDTYSAAIGHNYVIESEVKASCKEGGNIVYKCSHCGDSYSVTLAKLNHNYSIENFEATCTEKGYTKKTCYSCGSEIITNVVDALGHQFGNEWVKTAEGHYHVCDRCGEIDELRSHVAGAEATEISAQICSVCGYVITPALGHTCSEHLIAVDEVSADCLNNGNIKYYVCDCGKWYLDENAEQLITDHLSVIVDALGHDIENHNAVEPTCTEKGWSAGVWCKRCQKYVKGHVEIPATGHTYVAVVTKPTCENGGYTTYTCACGDSYKGNETAKLGHNYYDEIIAPTCTEKGYTKHTCLNCGDNYTDSEVDALGHLFAKDWITDGTYHWHTCSRCGVIDGKAEHTPDYETATEEHGITCTACGYIIAERLNHIHKGEKHDAVSATCTKGGNIEYYVCSCGDYFYDADCTKKVTDKSSLMTSALGHTNTLLPEVKATCCETGFTVGYQCDRCGLTTGHQVTEIDENNHADLVHHDGKDATCTEKGWIAYDTCSRCSYTTYEEIPELGHDLVHHDEKDATCTEKGWIAYDTCNRCSYTTYEEIPALNHDISERWSSDETYHWHTCSRCAEQLDKAEHTPDYAEATTEHGIHCSVCGYEIAKQLEDPTAEVKYTYDATITIEDMTITQHIDLYSNGVAKVWAVAGLERQDLEGVWVEKDGEVTITINNDPQVFYVNEDGKTLTQGNKPIEPTGELVYTYDDDMGGMILHYEFYDDNIMFATAKSNGQIYATMNGTWELKDGKVVATFDGGEEVFTINGDGTLSPYHEHAYSGWSSDETYHWHMCYRCGEIIDKAEHTPDYAEATEEHGIHCSVCGYEIAPALEKKRLPISKQEFIDIFSMENFDNVTIDYSSCIELGTVENGNREKSFDPSDVKVIIKYADGNAIFEYYYPISKAYYYFNGKPYVLDNSRYIPFTSDDEILRDIVPLLPDRLLSSICNLAINDGILYDSLIYNAEDSSYVLDMRSFGENTVFTFNLNDGKLSYWAMYSDTENDGDYSVFDVKYTLYNYNETEIVIEYEIEEEEEITEFDKAFDPSNFENFTCENPMGKQMFDYPNGLVFIDTNIGSSFQIMLYDGNWYRKENGEWAKADESDYIGFTYENMVGNFEAFKQFDHYYKDGAWIVNMNGETEVPFYIENDKIVYESIMSEKDTHFYDYGTTVIKIPEDLLDFIEKQGETPEKEIKYTGVYEMSEGSQTVQLLFTLYTDGSALIVAMGDEMPTTWINKNGIIEIDMMGMMGMMTCMFTVGDDNKTLVVYDPSEGATVLYTSEYAEFGATFEFYEGGTASMIYGGAKNPGEWSFVGENKIGASFMGQPMAFAVNEGSTKLTYISDMGNTEYYQWKFLFSDENGTLLYTSEVLEFVDDGNGKKIGSTEYNVEQPKMIVTYAVSADGVNFVSPGSGYVSEYELGETIFCLTIKNASFSSSHYLKGSYRENYFNRVILNEDGTCKCGYDKEGYEHNATGTWEKEGDVYILDLVGYGKLYYNARPYDGYDMKVELVPIEVKGEILYTYSSVGKGGYDTIRLFDNGLAKYSGWSSQLVFEYSLQDNTVICGEKINGELFKGYVNVLGEYWTVGGEEEVITIRNFFTYGNTNFALGKASYEDVKFSVYYTDNSEKVISFYELDSVEGSIDFNTAGRYTLTVEYEGHRLTQTYLVGDANDVRSRSMNGSNFVWLADDNGIVTADFSNVEVGSSNYDGKWSSIKLTAEDFDQDELNNALNGKVGGKYVIHTNDYCRIEEGEVLDKLYITVIILTENMIIENIEWVSLNGSSSFVYDLDNKKFVESEYTSLPSYRISVKIAEEIIETWEDEKGTHEVVNTKYESYAYFKPFSFEDINLPEIGDTYLTKAGKYTYKVKLLFGWEIDNNLTILSFDANTQIMFMGVIYDMDNYEMPMLELPIMQVNQSIEDYTKEVVSLINDNDNICVMVAWVTADTMDAIYEIQLDTVSAEMFDFSEVDSSKVGQQEGYLFVKDYNGNTTTITLAVKVA